MNQITESVLTEKIAQLDQTIEIQQRLIVALVFEVGKGKNISISKGNQRQADQKIGGINYRQLSSGEIRFTVTAPKEGNGDG